MSTHELSQAARLAPVALGGAAGTLARAGADAALAGWSTVLVNILGAFALGVLLEVLARGPATSDRAWRLRLLVGTGFLGAFTTYGTVAVQTAERLAEAPVLAVGQLLALLGAGVLAAAVGAGAGVLARRTARGLRAAGRAR